MNKTLYYIELTCIKDCEYPNTDFHAGDVLYFNRKSTANEMYLFNFRNKEKETNDSKKYNGIGNGSYLPFTRQKRFAHKWQIRHYPESICNWIEHFGEFTCQIKEIKMTYTEEEI